MGTGYPGDGVASELYTRWVPVPGADMDRKIPHPSEVGCGFRITSKECLYDSGQIGLQYMASSMYIVYDLEMYDRQT